MHIYANNAATTKMNQAAIQAMLHYMEDGYEYSSSPYTFGQRTNESPEDARRRVMNSLGFTAREITFTSGGSEPDNQAIFSAAAPGARRGKKHIISHHLLEGFLTW